MKKKDTGMTMDCGAIRIDILGDSGPFSRFGLSIGYRVRCGPASYLVDCGAPIFEFLKEQEVREIRGLIGTHSHDDHRRWFTDLALYKRYACGIKEKLVFITTETIQEEFLKNSRGALERSLSSDQKHVVEIPYDEYVNATTFGPCARYRIQAFPMTEESNVWRVVDSDGEIVSASFAKVVISSRHGGSRPRLLLRDEASGEWIEPENYYSFSDRAFYQEAQNVFRDEEVGLEIRPVKESTWHGPPTIGVRFSTANETVVFSSDTVYDPELWKALVEEYHPQKLGISRKEFEEAYVIYGDINDYVERIWSQRRYEEALHAYDGAVVIHDVSAPGSVVHTEYPKIAGSSIRPLILTHSPDRFTSELPLAIAGKTYVVKGNEVTEEVHGGERLPLDADAYHRNFGKAYVGYKNPMGSYRIVEKGNGYVDVVPRDASVPGKTLYHIDLFEDIHGRYFPVVESASQEYVVRPDGQVELRTYGPRGSRGKIVKDQRKRLSRRKRLAGKNASAGTEGPTHPPKRGDTRIRTRDKAPTG